MISSCIRTCRHVLVCCVVPLAACAPSQFTTLSIYETPDAFVRLEIDRNLEQDIGHSHPVDISTEQMTALLSGLLFEEPMAKLPFYDDLDQPRQHSAFTEPEITLLAPLLATALKKAGPSEIVMFYHSSPRSSTQRLVTSGGLFVDGSNLHFLLANYRSPTHFSADIGVADTTDERLTPLRALAPQRGRLQFEPIDAVEEPADAGLGTLFQPKRREIIIRYKRVPPRGPTRIPTPPSPHP